MFRILASIVFACLLLSACTSSTEREYTSLLRDATKAVKGVTTIEALDSVQNVYMPKIAEFAQTHAKELDAMSEAEKERLTAVQQTLTNALQEQTQHLLLGL